MGSIFSKKNIVRKKPEQAKVEEAKELAEPRRRRKQQNLLLYEIIYNKMNESGMEEITIEDFKTILGKLRVQKKFWFIIVREMKEMYRIKFNGKRITIKSTTTD